MRPGFVPARRDYAVAGRGNPSIPRSSHGRLALPGARRDSGQASGVGTGCRMVGPEMPVPGIASEKVACPHFPRFLPVFVPYFALFPSMSCAYLYVHNFRRTHVSRFGRENLASDKETAAATRNALSNRGLTAENAERQRGTRNERRNGTAFNAEHAENAEGAEKGGDRGKATANGTAFNAAQRAPF